MAEARKKVTRTKDTNTKADAVLTMFDTISADVLASVTAKIDRRVAAKVKELEARVESARQIQLFVGDTPAGPAIDGLYHEHFPLLLQVLGTNSPAMLVGPAGTGKSFAAESAALAMGLPFYGMSVGAQTSKSDLIGYMDATGKYVRTVFRDAYESGGVFLLDEIDAGNSNVLIQLNAALANGYMSFPDGMIAKHDDFRIVATANTFGLGANRQYVGRNQLDAATLDRFTVITWPIDERVEESMAVGADGADWLQIVRYVRGYVEENDMRVVVSPRATQRGSRLLAAGVEFNHVLHSALLSQFTGDILEQLHATCHNKWQSFQQAKQSTSTVAASAGWIDDVTAMTLDGAYTFCFGDVPSDFITDDLRDKSKVIIDAADDWAKTEFVRLVRRPDANYASNHWRLRATIYHGLRESGWDFRPHIAALVAADAAAFTPAGLENIQDIQE